MFTLAHKSGNVKRTKNKKITNDKWQKPINYASPSTNHISRYLSYKLISYRISIKTSFYSAKGWIKFHNIDYEYIYKDVRHEMQLTLQFACRHL